MFALKVDSLQQRRKVWIWAEISGTGNQSKE